MPLTEPERTLLDCPKPFTNPAVKTAKQTESKPKSKQQSKEIAMERERDLQGDLEAPGQELQRSEHCLFSLMQAGSLYLPHDMTHRHPPSWPQDSRHHDLYTMKIK